MTFLLGIWLGVILGLLAAGLCHMAARSETHAIIRHDLIVAGRNN